MITAAIMKGHPLPRWPRFMVLDWAFELPFLVLVHAQGRRRPGEPLQRDPPPRARPAGDGLPRGRQGTGKPFSERYRLQRFGRGGLRRDRPAHRARRSSRSRSSARRRSTRSSPTAPPLARAVGAPFVPITPTFPWLGPLGLIPLPSRWRIEFCEPIDLSALPARGGRRPAAVFDLSEQVRETIQAKLYENLVERGSAFA